MARPNADDTELRRTCASAIGAGGSAGDIVLAVRVDKGRGILEKLGRVATPRVLVLTNKISSSPLVFYLLCQATLFVFVSGRGTRVTMVRCPFGYLLPLLGSDHDIVGKFGIGRQRATLSNGSLDS